MKQINLSLILGRSFRLFAVIALLLVWSISARASEMVNQVKNSPSPYLAAHGDDPVAWQEWNQTTLERARRENKLLFVSIGYFSCHWCHVMQAESYRNAETAALINENFIPVKVDRELEVALDAEMIAYAQGILGSAGWPLNVFITPEGYPLYAILYEKPVRFRLMLESLSKEWKKDSEGLKVLAKKSVKDAPLMKKIKLDANLAEQYRKQLVQETLTQVDLLGGGLNVARKFPLAPQLAALLEIESVQHDAKLAEWLQLTLDQMMNGGLRDHLAGGFFRYTVDPDWQRPHFEKMLYDNAQLAMIYLNAAKIFKRPDYRDIAIQTLDCMLAEMRIDGAFITSLSALNNDGKEGGAYLWTEAQLKETLNREDYQLVSKIWGMDIPSEYEGSYLPMLRKVVTADEAKRLQDIYSKLLPIRQLRISPKDIKLLAGLNGLALEAFSSAAGISPRFRQAADELRSFMVNKLWQDGALLKGQSAQQSLGAADLEAYAYAASGLMRYSQLSKNSGDAKIAVQIAQSAWQKFYSPRGFLLEQQSELARPFYQSIIEDGPLPSPSSKLIDVSLQSGNKELQAQAREALAFGEALHGNGLFWHASQISALSRLFPFKPVRR